MSIPDKIDLGTQGFIYPMPMTLVGVDLEEQPTFMPVAWVNRVEFNPARIALGMNKTHATGDGIWTHKEFSVCIPDESMVAVTDWCGLNSASRGAEKARQFEIFRGNLSHAPMIATCPLCLECVLFQTVDIGSHDLFIADIVGTWTEERFLLEGKPDIEKMRPFTLTMPDNRYWSVGPQVGKAWSDGRNYQPKM